MKVYPESPKSVGQCYRYYTAECSECGSSHWYRKLGKPPYVKNNTHLCCRKEAKE